MTVVVGWPASPGQCATYHRGARQRSFAIAIEIRLASGILGVPASGMGIAAAKDNPRHWIGEDLMTHLGPEYYAQ
jgi:hypothetical protein